MAIRNFIGGALRAAPVIAIGAAAVDATRLYDNQTALAGAFQQNLKFPSDLKSDVPYISMQFKEYTRRSIYDQPFYNEVMKINLPVPSNLVEQTNIQYSTENLGSIVGSVVEGLSAIGTGTAGNIATGGLTIASGIGAGILPSTIARLLSSTTRIPEQASEALVSSATQAISVLSGITTNPFQAVLFKSPSFRSHQFSWTLIPKSRAESEVINNIIQTFRYHSLPGVSNFGGVFFSYPEILEINFRPTDTYLYKFKPCVVDSIRVNFAPNQPSFYKSSLAPTAVEFSITVQEIEIWTKSDFNRNGEQTANSTPSAPTTTPNLPPVNGQYDQQGNFQPGIQP
jgi:hypothetical protein